MARKYRFLNQAKAEVKKQYAFRGDDTPMDRTDEIQDRLTNIESLVRYLIDCIHGEIPVERPAPVNLRANTIRANSNNKGRKQWEL